MPDSHTSERLRSLLKATRVVAGELELSEVLKSIIVAAVELVGARFGAIGVIAPDGTLEQFIHTGLPQDVVTRIGRLPEGHGLLGALIDEQEPIRLRHLADDPRSSGFPAGHPPMDSFLGVPVRVRGVVYGNLYFSESTAGEFSAEDQELIVELAATAGGAIDHARLFDETRRRQRWASALAEVTAALLSDDAVDSLGVVAERIATLAEADLVTFLGPASPTTLRVELARGVLASEVTGLVFGAHGTIAGRALESGQPVLSDAAPTNVVGEGVALGPTMAIPLSSSGGPTSLLTVSRAPGRPRFTEVDLGTAADFARQASVALRLAAGRADRLRLATLDDRSRIARDLHDHVIQRLFGAGLSLQALAGSLPDAASRTRLSEQVDALDAAIAEIRTAIFTMTASDADRPSLRHRIIDLLSETDGLFDRPPVVSFAGAVDTMVDAALADDIAAVVREGLTNVARHAAAHTVTIAVVFSAGVITVKIDDDGSGFDPAAVSRSSGTANLAQRAEARGGTFALEPRDPRGTALTWTARVEADR
ncbi:MAG: GAF domain-containing protein [Rhodoglobus sp.]